MTKAGGGRKRTASGKNRTSPTDQWGEEGGPDEAVAFIAETVAELVKLAERHRLECSVICSEWRSSRRKNGCGPGAGASCPKSFRQVHAVTRLPAGRGFSAVSLAANSRPSCE